MSFVQRELNRIAVELRNHPTESTTWKELYAAQAALSWATDPQMYKSPYNTVMGVPSEQAASAPISEH